MPDNLRWTKSRLHSKEKMKLPKENKRLLSLVHPTCLKHWPMLLQKGEVFDMTLEEIKR